VILTCAVDDSRQGFPERWKAASINFFIRGRGIGSAIGLRDDFDGAWHGSRGARIWLEGFWHWPSFTAAAVALQLPGSAEFPTQ